MYHIEDYNYSLPPELIAQHPAKGRDRSRLLCLDKQTGCVSHRRFAELPDLLSPADLLVVNNTAVVPARLIGKKATGGRVELLILDWPGLLESAAAGAAECDCLIKASKTPKPGGRLDFDGGLSAEVRRKKKETFRVRFFSDQELDRLLHAVGRVPLPPYIRRNASGPSAEDRAAYQTVYAKENGAVAAPTAGLHFTRELIEKIRVRGIPVVEITLHVGYGTFFPVKVADIRSHRMHAEHYWITPAAAGRINRHRSDGGRVVAVGTTCVRTLEHAAGADGTVSPGSGSCDLFIYPGYRFRVIDALITNFHLPRSTLLMLVSAFAGREQVLSAYRDAVNKQYRFFSYGDAMFMR